MRPVQLDMNGFASFRTPATVDFTDAEYFALIGPTGSGKSTVIDAMTFALYGSVPRWEDERTVAPALAPTANKGTVRMVFDVGSERYVIARDVRRSTTGVGIRGSRLERLMDPTARGVDTDDVEDLATDSAVTPAVEKLLGLSFKNFCQCVVLPQGQFADFLREKPAKRQKILFHLLGAERYDAIRERASTRAAVCAQQAELLAGQSAQYADATSEAEDAAAGRVAELGALTTHLDIALPALAKAASTLQTTRSTCDELRSQEATLRSIAVPDGLAALDSQLALAQDALTEASELETGAQLSDTTAREAMSAAPEREPFERAVRQRTEHAGLTVALPTAQQDAAVAIEACEHATATCQRAGEQLHQARGHRDETTASAVAAAQAAEQLTAEILTLRAVSIPTELSELSTRVRQAREELTDAEQRRADAEQRDTAARAAADAAPARAPLDKALVELRELDELSTALVALQATAEQAEQSHQQARQSTGTAEEALEAATEAREVAALTARAAELREHLSAGDSCPVCEQAVSELPSPLEAPELTFANAAIKAAQAHVTAARSHEADASRGASQAAGACDTARTQIGRLQAALIGQPSDPAVIEAALGQLDAAALEVREAGLVLAQARTHVSRAQARAAALDTQTARLRTTLRSTRDPLVRLGAPDVDDTDLLVAFTELHEWAQQQGADRTGRLPELTSAADERAASAATAEKAFVAAEQAEQVARKAESAATGLQERRNVTLETMLSQLEQLTTELAGAPTQQEAETVLAHLQELQNRVRSTDLALRTARTARESAQQAARQHEAHVTAAWQALRAARDPLVPLGAPEPAGTTPLEGWTSLLDWAHAAADTSADQLTDALEAVTAADQQHAEAVKNLTDYLAEHDVALPVGADLLTGAPTAVARTLEQQRATHARITERRTQAAALEQQRTAAVTDQQVAKKLADLLRSNQFPRWLVTSALDALVLDASATLKELSGGQFELTHKSEEFFVVDHADADSLRSVRTLSGGETFQASLALALALSSQMSALSGGGTARLDSIFLDEGFGTLDEATLEVVAETLENLAHGDRMVGVITHVAVLAERVPVRFLVHRDASTSTVIRESA